MTQNKARRTNKIDFLQLAGESFRIAGVKVSLLWVPHAFPDFEKGAALDLLPLNCLSRNSSRLWFGAHTWFSP